MAQLDPFKGSNVLPTYPPRRAQAVDISTTDFVPNSVTRRLLVGVGGDVVVVMADDNANVTLKLAAGIHELQIAQIIKVGTTATDMVALFG